MKILGIETSCDETAAAVVEDLPAGKQFSLNILSNVVASSANMHAKTGGIIPEQAARQQIKSIIPVIEQSLMEAFPKSPNLKSQISNLDALSVTVGPGLIGSLLVGVETAKTLSYLWKKPIVPINHLVAHIYANWLGNSVQRTVGSEQNKTEHRTLITEHKTPQFPALALVVSGGHTDLVLMKDHPSASPSTPSSGPRGSGQANIKWIGGTRDDAAGEAFDKCARLLGLPYPGGPAIAAEAAKFQMTNGSTGSPSRAKSRDSKFQMKKFPRPLIDEDDFDFSFSGLKTAVLRELTNQPINESSVPKLAAEIQEAIVDSLVDKSIRAIKYFKPRSFLLAGGVAANKRLREIFLSRIKTEILSVFHVSQPSLCTDNAAVIAACAFYNYHPVDWKKIKADPGLTIMGEI